MGRRKLTKEDIDRVRHIEGFPVCTDEDIMALADPPYFTSVPNMFIKDSIMYEQYSEENDNYSAEPFTAEISEGKHDPMYMAHSYHTKVPYKAIMRYILNYTKPGDIVLDGFSGSGMTGVAAQMCGTDDYSIQQEIKSTMPKAVFGTRKAILSELSPAAGFIAYNYNTAYDRDAFCSKAEAILTKCEQDCGWVYHTTHNGNGINPLVGSTGRIEYSVWSDVFVCPSCGEEIVLWDISVLPGNKIVDNPRCSMCGASIDKNKCERVKSTYFDERLGKVVSQAKQVPVRVYYSYLGKRYSKDVDEEDLALVERIESQNISCWYPTDELPSGYNTEQPK